MLKDIEVASLGCVGNIVNAVVLHVSEEDSMRYMMGPFDIELYTHITEVMPKLVNIVLRSIYVFALYTCNILFCFS